MCALQVGECSTNYPESARAIERVSLLTKYFCLFCLCLRNLSILKFCAVHCRLLLVRLDCLLQFFTSGSVKVSAEIGNTHLIALRSQRPMLSGALGTVPEAAYARLLDVRIDFFLGGMDNRTNRVVLGSNLGVQLDAVKITLKA